MKSFARSLLRTAIALFLSLGATSTALSAAPPRIFEFIYTSTNFGRLGSFTMSESDLLANIGNPYPGYVSNQFILDLNFAYGGLTWTRDHIDRDDQTIYGFVNGIPQVVGGNGSLAQLPHIPSRFGAITIFHPSLGTEFGTPPNPIPGTWTTTVHAIPEPSAASLCVAALAPLALRRRSRAGLPTSRHLAAGLAPRAYKGYRHGTGLS